MPVGFRMLVAHAMKKAGITKPWPTPPPPTDRMETLSEEMARKNSILWFPCIYIDDPRFQSGTSRLLIFILFLVVLAIAFVCMPPAKVIMPPPGPTALQPPSSSNATTKPNTLPHSLNALVGDRAICHVEVPRDESSFFTDQHHQGSTRRRRYTRYSNAFGPSTTPFEVMVHDLDSSLSSNESSDDATPSGFVISLRVLMIATPQRVHVVPEHFVEQPAQEAWLDLNGIPLHHPVAHRVVLGSYLGDFRKQDPSSPTTKVNDTSHNAERPGAIKSVAVCDIPAPHPYAGSAVVIQFESGITSVFYVLVKPWDVIVKEHCTKQNLPISWRPRVRTFRGIVIENASAPVWPNNNVTSSSSASMYNITGTDSDAKASATNSENSTQTPVAMDPNCDFQRDPHMPLVSVMSGPTFHYTEPGALEKMLRHSTQHQAPVAVADKKNPPF